eukprot:TRINITY_DN3233_c3_g9_i1.p1 TRINITY_DN3233_c3_g9~~TRINITY_DN3233_c3_g9_i1.p1  ORF type:complete len:1231 (+),score=390.45 TRINITY_DN3233_c3_g9_i1:32-3694(+)
MTAEPSVVELRRRRMMLNEQQKAQQLLVEKRREELFLDSLLKKSNKELEMAEEIYKVSRTTEIMEEKRKQRLIEKEEQKKLLSHKRKEAALLRLKTLKETVEKEKEESLVEMNRLREQHAIKVHQENVNFIQLFLQDYFSFFNNFADHYEATKTSKVSPISIKEWKNLLMLGNDAYKDDEAMLEDLLDEKNYFDFTKMQNEWNFKNFKNFKKIEDTEVTEVTETTEEKEEDIDADFPGSENQSFANILSSLYRLVKPNTIIETPPSMYNFPLKIALLGYDFSGKSELAEFLASRFFLHVFKMNELIDEAIESSKMLEMSTIDFANDFSPILLDDVEDLKIDNDFERYNVQMGRLGLYIRHFQEENQSIPDVVLANIVYIASAYLPLKYKDKKINHDEKRVCNVIIDDEIPLGWVIEGFPSNPQQIEAINNIFNGFKKDSCKRDFFDGLFAYDVLSDTVIDYCTHLYVNKNDKIVNIDDLSEINEKDTFRPFVDPQILTESLEKYDIILSNIEKEGGNIFHQFSKENKEEMKNIRCVDYYEETEEQIFRILKNAELKESVEERCKEMEVWDVYSCDIDEIEASLIKKEQSVEEDGDKDNQATIEKKHYGIEAEEAQKLLELWEETDNVYNKAIKKSFSILRNNKQTLIEKVYEIQDKFRKLIVEVVPINKNLHEFQKQFNEVEHELRANEQVKEELKKQTTELRCSIYEILDQRREELFAEKKKIITSQLFKNVVSIVGSSYCDIVRVEIIRLRTIIDLINQYKGYLICETPVELLEAFAMPSETKSKGKTNDKSNKTKAGDKKKKGQEESILNYDVCAEISFTYPTLNEAFDVALQQADSITELKEALLQAPFENLEEFAKDCFMSLEIERILVKKRLTLLNYLSNCDFEAIEAQAKALEEYFNDLLIKQYLHDVQQVKGLVAHVIDHITDESPLGEALYFNNEHKLIVDDSKELSALPEPKELSWIVPVDDFEFSDDQLKLFMCEIRNFKGYNKKMVHIEDLAQWMYKLSHNQTETPILPGKYHNLSMNQIKKMLNSLNHKNNLIDWKLFVIRFLNRELICLNDDIKLDLGLFIDFDGTKDSLRMPILIKDIFYELLADPNESISRTKLFLYLSHVEESSLESFKNIWSNLEIINGFNNSLSKQCCNEIINFAVEPLNDTQLDRLYDQLFITFEEFAGLPFGHNLIRTFKRFMHKHYSIQTVNPPELSFTMTTEDIHTN